MLSVHDQLWCPRGMYNAYGVLFFNPIDQVRGLSSLVSVAALTIYSTTGTPQVLASMVDYQSKIGLDYLFYIPSLALMFVLGYLFMVTTYGTAAPTGLFIPCLIVGAAGGRLVGRVVR